MCLTLSDQTLKTVMALVSVGLNATFLVVLFVEFRKDYIVFYAHSRVKLCLMCVCKSEHVKRLVSLRS